MTDFEKVKAQINIGLSGNAFFLNIDHKKLGERINITHGMYILFGGMPGSGKTSIVDGMFVIDLFDWWEKNPTKCNPYWLYRSMERPRHLKIAKWLCYKLFKDHKILIDVPTLFGWPGKLFDLTPDIIKLIDSYQDYFQRLEQRLIIIDGTDTPSEIFKAAKKFADKYGKITQVDQYNKIYTLHDPSTILIHVVDHAGKISSEKGYNDKQVLDEHSKNMGTLRDFYGLVCIDIMQLNRELEDTLRQVKLELDISPKDFKGSGDLYENADLVFGLMNPYKLKDWHHMGYDIARFVDSKGYNRFRSLKVLKNSYGIDDFKLGFLFLGENGMMRELDPPSKFDNERYQKILNSVKH